MTAGLGFTGENLITPSQHEGHDIEGRAGWTMTRPDKSDGFDGAEEGYELFMGGVGAHAPSIERQARERNASTDALP